MRRLTAWSAAALLAALALGAGRAAAAQPPRLVLLLVVDQLLPQFVDPRLPGGLGRLAREGRRFADATLGHAPSETCPGHAAIASGRHPGPAGIPGNQWIERATGRLVWCVDDASTGRSPRALRVSTLGDWMKAQRPASRVVALGGKDRGAIVLGGHRADGAFWLDAAQARGFTTSRHYRDAPPPWLLRFNGSSARDGFLAGLPERWEHASGPANGARRDDHPGESPRYRRTSGHPIRADDRAKTLLQLSFTPFLDRVTLDLARILVTEHDLGRDDVPDLLALSLSANDLVGHLYGPASQEASDLRRRLDVWLGAFLDELLEASGGRLLVALTADHGVLPLPEWLHAVGRAECPVPGARVDALELRRAMVQELEARFGAPPDAASPWVLRAGLELTVNRPLAAARGVDPERIAAAAARFLADRPGIARVWTHAERSSGSGPGPFAELYARSFDAERSGDLSIQPARGCLLSPWPDGTTHGSPYAYDRAVPLVFWGAGVAPGVVRGPAGLVDVAPTLAARLGVRAPAELDGRVLELAPEP